MRRPLAAFRELVAPTAVGDQASRRDAVLRLILGGLLVLSLLTQLIQLVDFAVVRDPTTLVWWGVNVAVAGLAWALLGAAARGHRRGAATALVALLLLLATLLLAADGAAHPTWAFVATTGVVLASTLLGARAGIVAALLTAAAFLLASRLEAHGVVVPLAPAESRSEETVSSVLAATLLALAIVGACWLTTRDAQLSIEELLTGAPESASSPLRQLRTASLTVREVEVTRLVAEGRTNDQIAAELFLSPRTVQSHVANAMRKTDAANRTALGVLAVREGLAPLADAPG